MNKNLSIHLADFPDVSSFNDEKELIANMDMVRQICSVALFIRDQKNLRVRLPLKTLKIIGKNAEKMADFKEIIADEVNVKNIEITNEIGDLAELKLQINFKKIGGKLGAKMKDVTIASKQNQWKKIADDKIEIAGEILEGDDFELKLIAKNSENTAALPSNDCLVELDIVVTKELEDEGLARDIIRAIQQNRKDANLDVSDHIKIVVSSKNEDLLRVVGAYKDYICEQTLTDEMIVSSDEQVKSAKHQFENKIEEIEVKIGINL